MREVTGVDNAGRELLAAMHHAGAHLIAKGVWMTALIEDITSEQPFNGTKRHVAEERTIPMMKIPGSGETVNETQFRFEIETRGMGISRCAGGRAIVLCHSFGR